MGFERLLCPGSNPLKVIYLTGIYLVSAAQDVFDHLFGPVHAHLDPFPVPSLFLTVGTCQDTKNYQNSFRNGGFRAEGPKWDFSRSQVLVQQNLCKHLTQNSELLSGYNLNLGSSWVVTIWIWEATGWLQSASGKLLSGYNLNLWSYWVVTISI